MPIVARAPRRREAFLRRMWARVVLGPAWSANSWMSSSFTPSSCMSVKRLARSTWGVRSLQRLHAANRWPVRRSGGRGDECGGEAVRTTGGGRCGRRCRGPRGRRRGRGGPDGLTERDVADRGVGVLDIGPAQAFAGRGVGPYLFGLPQRATGVGGQADQQQGAQQGPDDPQLVLVDVVDAVGAHAVPVLRQTAVLVDGPGVLDVVPRGLGVQRERRAEADGQVAGERAPDLAGQLASAWLPSSSSVRRYRPTPSRTKMRSVSPARHHITARGRPRV